MENNSENKPLYVTWQSFREDCNARISNFKSHPILLFYFVVVVVFVGASGVWLPFLIETDTKNPCFNITSTLTVGLATYCIALLAAAMADNLLSLHKLKTLRFFIFSLFLLSITLAYVTLITKTIGWGVVTTLLTLVMWILNYSDDDSKKDSMEPPGDTPAGGPTTQELAGNLDGFIS